MPFNNQGQTNERLIIAGGPGVGKTRAYLTIAEMLRLTKADVHFRIVDIDWTVERSLLDFPKLMEWDNFHYTEALDYEEIRTAAQKYRKATKPGDWLVADLGSKVWEKSQEHYIDRTFGDSKADYFLMKRAEVVKASKGKDGNPLDGWEDWPVIKQMNAEVMNLLTFHKGHSIVTTGTKPVDRKNDPKELVMDFGHLGHRPDGEKKFAHNVHTAIFLEQRKRDEWVMTTGKDRGREYFIKEPVKNFARDYLIKYAGWSLK